ncbi:putative isocitrate dehydrogenase (NADP(+)) [Rosa chinensis]|uniref:Putative isocitrate dehydrogenase (NADP(+)) n=1 Tax=Rosa chinensis TaxID=74649 RepID=A0A2P6RCN5_ROSCH|nr:putative isocitrate dehydrogenase (NADP(+)) [Rosa chinensis]
MSRETLASSSSSIAPRNPSFSFTSTPRRFNGVGNRVSFAATSNRTSLRCYASTSGGFEKVRVKNRIVEMDGDEMTRIIWTESKKNLFSPYFPLCGFGHKVL